jgi:hypothetical protein
MQQSINIERAERELLEERLQEKRAAREKMVDEERRTRIKFFKKNMMAKFSQQMAKFSQQMGNQQVITVIFFPPCKIYFQTCIVESALLFAGA